MDYWKLSENVADCRPYLLDETETFSRLVQRLVEADVLEAKWEWGRQPILKEYARARFEIAVHPRDYDLFFSGCNGYRSRYFRSVEEGVLANHQLLLAMSEKVYAMGHSFGLDADYPVTEVHRSLASTGAKAWINEAELNEHEPNWQPADVDEIRDEVLVPRWVEGIREYAAQAEKSGLIKNAILAGTRAFQGSRLTIFGGFIVPCDPKRSALVAPDKGRRPCQIHDYGFS